MPKEYFQLENCKSLSELSSTASIYFMGIAGVAMGQLAVAMNKAGYRVSGSDKAFYEPMGSFLKASGLSLFEGYSSENIPADVDLVVIGNAISYGHPEVERVEKEGLSYTCFAKLLSEFLVSGCHSIVLSGTHGKTTTSTLSTHLFKELGTDPSFFIGGNVEAFGTGLEKTSGKYSIVEGDEYDTAFFAKTPKFHFYSPDTLVINAIEYDHSDIYHDLEAINAEFEKLVLSMPEGSRVLYCSDFENLKICAANWKAKAKAKLESFGFDEKADFQICNRKQHPDAQDFLLEADGEAVLELCIPLLGAYNARNASAAALVALQEGFEKPDIENALKSAPLPKRRQEIRFSKNGKIFIEDFAHHPTAVHQTLEALRECYPEAKIHAIFEPRSAASRRKTFQDDYIKAFDIADEVSLRKVDGTDYDQGHELLNVEELAVEVSKAGTPCKAFENGDNILENLNISDSKQVFVVMSNGAFDGLPAKLQAKLEKEIS